MRRGTYSSRRPRSLDARKEEKGKQKEEKQTKSGKECADIHKQIGKVRHSMSESVLDCTHTAKLYCIPKNGVCTSPEFGSS